VNEQTTGLASELKKILGEDRVISDPEELLFYSSDVYSRGTTAGLVIRPGDVSTVAAAASAISQAGYSITARGGGMSYTGGYIPEQENTVIFDLGDLNRIIEISEDDMFITVEAGVTWNQIYEALNPLGLRLPFFGTFSGYHATVGGGMSNGALFMATARYGTAAEIVLGLEVVSSEGRTVRTGQAAFHNGRPFYRTYGPDLTGLFIHDAGSLGIKTQISMRLIKQPSEVDFASFAFSDEGQATQAMSAIARSDATEEVYVFDPATTSRSLDPTSLREDLRKLSGVVRGQSSLIKGLREGAKMVGAGRRFVDTELYTLHVVCAGRSVPAVDADMGVCRKIATEFGGGEIANTMPKAARAEPFGPLNGILGTNGERWAALNSKVAHSDASQLIERTNQLLDTFKDRMEAHGVTTSFLYIAISNHAFSYEPVLRWDDEWLPIHKRTPEPAFLAGIEEPAANPEARALVGEIRQQIVELFAEFGAASNQIGKTYRYLESLNPETRQLLQALKTELDPNGLMNPGALGWKKESAT
jgi:FAD/FMN-containing dehydrogenase